MNVVSPDGIRIGYDVAGAGPLILLLHGFSHDRRMWHRAGWVERLRADFTVATMDFRGCGDSDKPEAPGSYSVQAHIADIEAVLAPLRATRPIIWGWSFGATVALHLAKRRVAAATVAAGTYFGPIFTPTYVEARLADATTALQRTRWSDLGSWPAVEPNEIQNPLLVYSGTRDGNVVEQLERQRSAIESAGAHLHVLAGLNHGELITATQPVAAVVEPFIRAPA